MRALAKLNADQVVLYLIDRSIEEAKIALGALEEARLAATQNGDQLVEMGFIKPPLNLFSSIVVNAISNVNLHLLNPVQLASPSNQLSTFADLTEFLSLAQAAISEITRVRNQMLGSLAHADRRMLQSFWDGGIDTRFDSDGG